MGEGLFEKLTEGQWVKVSTSVKVHRNIFTE